ncbi:OmpL47-type beta-barrel domain-containing protein [Kibdelosporangium persicum]|uniref:Copper binding plastocyanin/azurin family protein n=1 Tax=Kibdelosporangium persicum TaxID=2698649 RepID=A0ABX2F2B0_9PSEU|nr:plastocyanin/azurin family copper-binding protein [Kibdelosporangium persicum]NRN65481.1 Copper binding plastocyanin/azurin family protein [Kibdelosporangium persicum]
MFRRLITGVAGALMVTSIAVAVPASAGPIPDPVLIQAQTLTWTTDNDMTRFKSAPTHAAAGTTTIVLENGPQTQSQTTHNLTFDQSTPGYNHDVSVNLTVDAFLPPYKAEVTVTLTPGKYRYFCALPGHQTMAGELIVGPTQPDTTPPTVNATVTGTKNTNGDYVGKATVGVTATDSESGVDKVEYQVDDTSWQTYTQPFDVTAIGDHSVQYRATDKAGNVSQTGSTQFRVVEPPSDTTPPTVNAAVTGDKDANGNYISKATVAITATDSESGVKSTEYKLDSGDWTPYTAPFDVTTTGAHMVHYRATDNANNVSTEGMTSFTIVGQPDTTPPTVNATVTGDKDASGNYISKATVAITATDSQSGVKSTEYKLDSGAWTPYTAPVEVTATGSHMVHYRATDNANNVSAEGMTSFTIVGQPDTTPPTVNAAVTGDKDPNGNYISKATVTITATDSQSGVKSTEYKLDSGAWTPYTAPFDVTATGAHMVHYRATDNANNVSAEGMTSFTIVGQPDTTPPTVNAAVTGDKDPNGNYIAKATVTITATDSQSGVKSTEYKVDSGNWTAYTAPFDVTATGAHMVHYRATDNANNVSAEGMTSFTIAPPPADTTAPTTNATVAGPKDPNGNFVDTASVTITATDSQSGVKLVEYSLDNGAWTQYTNTFPVSAKGAHTVKYRASDNAGNVAPEKSVSFTVVEPGTDACPESDTRETVIIGRDDTGVANVDTGNGCTVSDLVDQYGDWPSHGVFVRHVDAVTTELVNRGVLSPRDAGTIVRAASRSDIGN